MNRNHRYYQTGLVLVSTGILQFGKPSADSGHRVKFRNLNINANNDNYELAAA